MQLPYPPSPRHYPQDIVTVRFPLVGVTMVGVTIAVNAWGSEAYGAVGRMGQWGAWWRGAHGGSGRMGQWAHGGGGRIGKGGRIGIWGAWKRGAYGAVEQ
ncbi:unnamed protein product [Closterium sp. NIES-65]|nr:unnamed protein product [Closterium sp. NIES-65]